MFRELSTGYKDNEEKVWLFEFLLHLEKWRRNQTWDEIEFELEEQPQYFHLRLEESANNFISFWTDANWASSGGKIWPFNLLNTEIPVVHCGRLAKNAKYCWSKINYFTSWEIWSAWLVKHTQSSRWSFGIILGKNPQQSDWTWFE